MDARTTIPAFDAFLAERKLTLRATVIGGAALQLLNVIDRPTEDCDVLDPVLAQDIVDAAKDFAAQQPVQPPLSEKWFNNGPVSLTRTLPKQWSQRVRPLYAGQAIQLSTLAREDLLRSKLFAYVDRNIDLPDCKAMAPTRDELQVLLPWLDEQDGNEQWPDYVRIKLQQLARELGYEL